MGLDAVYLFIKVFASLFCWNLNEWVLGLIPI